jgi:purine-nucleoside phosphorylase
MSAEQPSFASTFEVLREHVPDSLLHPVVGVVCGSGLSTLGSSLRNKVLVSYDILPGFAKSTGRF